MKLYELAGADDNHRFSPFAWRTRLALAHKGLSHESVPWRFTEKEAIAFSGQGKVPVLVDGEKVVSDSWNIAEYLDEAYPNHPPLFDSPMAQGEALFIKHWIESTLLLEVLKVIVMDVHRCLDKENGDYFRETREEMLGTTLEDFEDKSPEQIERLAEALGPARQTLKRQSFLCGKEPGFADLMLLALFLFAGAVCDTSLLKEDDPVYQWRKVMFKRYGDALHGLEFKGL